MSDLFQPCLADMIAEVEREIALRRHVYPKWVAARKLSQQKADRQIAVMEALAVHLRRDAAHEGAA